MSKFQHSPSEQFTLDVPNFLESLAKPDQSGRVYSSGAIAQIARNLDKLLPIPKE